MEIKEAIHMLKSYASMSKKLTDNTGRPKLDQAIKIVLKENFEMKNNLEAIQLLNLYIGYQDYDNSDNLIIDYKPFSMEDLEDK